MNGGTVTTLQNSSELWFRSPHLIQMITYHQHQFTQWHEMKSYPGYQTLALTKMHSSAQGLFFVIGPLIIENQEYEKTDSEGTKMISKTFFQGQKTKRFQDYHLALGSANDYILLSQNHDFDKYERAMAAQEALSILLAVMFMMLRDVDTMGFNFQNKQSGHRTGITGN